MLHKVPSRPRIIGNLSLRCFTFPWTSPKKAFWVPRTCLVVWAWPITSSICTMVNSALNVDEDQWSFHSRKTNFQEDPIVLERFSRIQCKIVIKWFRVHLSPNVRCNGPADTKIRCLKHSCYAVLRQTRKVDRKLKQLEALDFTNFYAVRK